MSLPRLLGQLLILSAQIGGKAFTAAWQQARANIKAGDSALGGSTSTAAGANSRDPLTRQLRLTLDESYLIMNIRKELANSSLEGGGREDLLKEVVKNYERMMEANRNTSLYVQSKIVRARERIEAEFGELGAAPKEQQQQPASANSSSSSSS